MSYAIEPISACSAEAVTAILASSFFDDPIVRWMYPEPERYEREFANFVMCYGSDPFTRGSGAYHVDSHQGAFTWLPSGVHPDPDELECFFLDSVLPSRGSNALKLFEMSGRHQPSYPHCYMTLLGIDSRYRGRGFGSALMSYACELCDSKDEAAYLECSNPKNIPLYERFGFELLGRTEIDDSPPLFAMLRVPRARARK
ncbi:GNAT family N-acetyltransferase [Burkholderia sp. BCC1988]|uniref:GNAT family N-acetyltransferase n=1 Tax=Burkholderia sp. BCC1988 TaxID=2817443 RepID=UPI002AAFFECE|nr:GNAT family N-acetyltransferase [Burkholderia sp. BCC1988]